MKIPAKYAIPAACLLGVVGLELFLRLTLGLGTPPRVVADSAMGYRFQENQNLRRFGNRVVYNQYSQRSESPQTPKPPELLRILMLGDSVLNGGNRKDNRETIAELFEAKLSRRAEVLNASANSWGIGNQRGYLSKYGWFESDAAILQIGTHDLVQGTSKADPQALAQQPQWALQEAIAVYLWPKLRQKLVKPRKAAVKQKQGNPGAKERQFRKNMAILREIATEARDRNIPLFVLYTPNRVDLLPKPQAPEYRAQFFAELQRLGIEAIDTQTAWAQLPPETVAGYFIDGVHLSVAGNRAIAELLAAKLDRYF